MSTRHSQTQFALDGSASRQKTHGRTERERKGVCWRLTVCAPRKIHTRKGEGEVGREGEREGEIEVGQGGFLRKRGA